MEGALREGGRAPGLKLIETLAWDGSRALRAERHLARLVRGAAALGWACDVKAAGAALCDGRSGPARLRLTLDAEGVLEVTEAPLPPVAARWRVGLATERLRSDDPWLTVKSTRRAAYDRARAALAPGLDEAILLNERAEVCDGTITTVFFDRGAGLRTPPLSSGLLPGILRDEMLAGGLCREEVLPVADLADIALWVGNSLRGLIPAVFAP